MTTATETSIEALIGEMPAMPCESRGHLDQPFVHDGPAAYYARVTCAVCGLNVIKSYCALYAAFATHPSHDTECQCGHVAPASETIRILGPVKS